MQEKKYYETEKRLPIVIKKAVHVNVPVKNKRKRIILKRLPGAKINSNILFKMISRF